MAAFLVGCLLFADGGVEVEVLFQETASVHWNFVEVSSNYDLGVFVDEENSVKAPFKLP